MTGESRTDKVSSQDSLQNVPVSTTSDKSDFQFLIDIAKATHLREGAEGIRQSLWLLHRHRPSSTREWSRLARIPVPVLAAIRGELESRQLIQKGPHPTPTPPGNELLKRLFGSRDIPDPICPYCRGNVLHLPSELATLAEILAAIMSERPEADPALDQSHATPESSLMRALMLVSLGLIDGQVIFLGDDDLTSVALVLLVTECLPEWRDRLHVTVLDIDERYLTLIQECYDDLGMSVETCQLDVREPLPERYKGQFRAAVTDPPYTLDGITLFSWRCAELLTNAGGDLLLCYAPLDPETQHRIQGQLFRQGWILEGIYRDATTYIGSSIHAHRSDLYHLRLVEESRGCAPEIVSAACYSTVYTGQLREPGGIYRCGECGSEITVGPHGIVTTIAELKRIGCPQCGSERFLRYGHSIES